MRSAVRCAAWRRNRFRQYTSLASIALFRAGMLRECWEFRGFIVASVKRDFV